MCVNICVALGRDVTRVDRVRPRAKGEQSLCAHFGNTPHLISCVKMRWLRILQLTIGCVVNRAQGETGGNMIDASLKDNSLIRLNPGHYRMGAPEVDLAIN